MKTPAQEIRELANKLAKLHEAPNEQIEAYKKWFSKWNKLKSKDTYRYAEGIIQAFTNTGVTELDGRSDDDPNQDAYTELFKIFPEMDQDIEEIAHKIDAAGVSAIEPNRKSPGLNPMDDGGDDFTDYDLRSHGTELDTDDDGEGEGFTQKSMFDQLGKILDSQGNPRPVETVTTDDGKELEVSPEQAKVLRMFITTDKVKPFVRTQFIRDIQSSNGLIDFLDVADYNEMANLFVKKYL